jgi:hypothetical protein
MNCPRCGSEMLIQTTLLTRCMDCTWVEWRTDDYDVPADPMDGLECDSCQ